MPVTSFMQTVSFTIMPSMKQHLAKNYFCTANYNISSKKHFVFIFSVLFLKFNRCETLILYGYQSQTVNTFLNYINATSEKFLFFSCFPFSYKVYIVMMMSGNFHLFTNFCWMATLKNCFGDMVCFLLVNMT